MPDKFRTKKEHMILSLNPNITNDSTFTDVQNNYVSQHQQRNYDDYFRLSSDYIFLNKEDATSYLQESLSTQSKNRNPQARVQLDPKAYRRAELFDSFTSGISSWYNKKTNSDGTPKYTPSNIKETFPELYDLEKTALEIGNGYYTDSNGQKVDAEANYIRISFDKKRKGLFGINALSKDSDNDYKLFRSNYCSQYSKNDNNLDSYLISKGIVIDDDPMTGITTLTIPKHDGTSENDDEYKRILSALPFDSKDPISYLTKSPISVKGYYREDNGTEHELTKKEFNGWSIPQAIVSGAFALTAAPAIATAGLLGEGLATGIPAAINRWISTNDKATTEYNRGVTGWARDQASQVSFSEENYDLRRMMNFRDFYLRLRDTKEDSAIPINLKGVETYDQFDELKKASYLKDFKGAFSYSPRKYYIMTDGDVAKEVTNKDFNELWLERLAKVEYTGKDTAVKAADENEKKSDYQLLDGGVWGDGIITGPYLNIQTPKGPIKFIVNDGLHDEDRHYALDPVFYTQSQMKLLNSGYNAYVSLNGNKYYKDEKTGDYISENNDGTQKEIERIDATRFGSLICQDVIERHLRANVSNYVNAFGDFIGATPADKQKTLASYFADQSDFIKTALGRYYNFYTETGDLDIDRLDKILSAKDFRELTDEEYSYYNDVLILMQHLTDIADVITNSNAVDSPTPYLINPRLSNRKN